jgi:ribosomal protein S18 acetylase RimI-like enzyme
MAQRYASRILDGRDCPALFSLHRGVIETLPDSDLYLAKGAEYFKSRLEGELAASTAILGLFFGQEMIAYSSVRISRYSSTAPDPVIVPKPSWPDTTIALMEDAAVHPDHRGHGFQATLMRAKTDIARQRGAALDVTLVNVKNFPSLRTLLGERFVAIGTATVADGVSRLVLARSIEVSAKDLAPPSDLASSSQWISDWAGIQAMFARGYVAVAARQAADAIEPTVLIFAPRASGDGLQQPAGIFRQ